MIDPGHGGIDSGSENEGILEKDINLEISLKLKQALLDKGYRVLMTRSDDTALELRERSDFANEAEADLFISLHQNCYSQDTSVSGIEVYYNDDKQRMMNDLHNSSNRRLLTPQGQEIVELENRIV